MGGSPLPQMGHETFFQAELEHPLSSRSPPDSKPPCPQGRTEPLSTGCSLCCVPPFTPTRQCLLQLKQVDFFGKLKAEVSPDALSLLPALFLAAFIFRCPACCSILGLCCQPLDRRQNYDAQRSAPCLLFCPDPGSPLVCSVPPHILLSRHGHLHLLPLWCPLPFVPL